MTERSDEPGEHEVHESLRALDGPAEDDFEYRGPGQTGDDSADPTLDAELPGGVAHNTAAAGAGPLGAALLGIAGFVRRLRARGRYRSLGE